MQHVSVARQNRTDHIINSCPPPLPNDDDDESFNLITIVVISTHTVAVIANEMSHVLFV